MTVKSLLVAGCGFLGLQVARRFQREGWAVTGLVHSAERVNELAGEPFSVVSCDISSQEAVARFSEGREFAVVLHCASSGRGGVEDYRAVYGQGVRNLLAEVRPQQMVFTSSTSVYAQTGGEWVDEQSSAEPQKETGVVLREAEEAVLAADGLVLRLAALYGPERSILVRKFLSGDAVIEGDGSRWINQIHRDDAAAACLALVQAEACGIYNVADSEPLSQRAIYAFLAEHFARPLPPSGEVNLNRKRGVTQKRVSNAKLRGTGWEPTYPTFFAAVCNDPHLVGPPKNGATGADHGT